MIPKFITTWRLGIVRELSAMLVASMTWVLSKVGGVSTSYCSSIVTWEWSTKIAKASSSPRF